VSLGPFMRALALQEFHRRKANKQPVVMVEDFANLFFRALERRHSAKYAEERSLAVHEQPMIGGES
jgi:hypothetical protein